MQTTHHPESCEGCLTLAENGIMRCQVIYWHSQLPDILVESCPCSDCIVKMKCSAGCRKHSKFYNHCVKLIEQKKMNNRCAELIERKKRNRQKGVQK